MRLPLDHAGVPLPPTPQAQAIARLQAAVAALGAVLATSRTSGADEAAIAGAEVALKEGAAEAATSLSGEKDRVTVARVERAKLDKKRRRGAAAKK
jgi:hypothetical protein